MRSGSLHRQSSQRRGTSVHIEMEWGVAVEVGVGGEVDVAFVVVAVVVIIAVTESIIIAIVGVVVAIVDYVGVEDVYDEVVVDVVGCFDEPWNGSPTMIIVPGGIEGQQLYTA